MPEQTITTGIDAVVRASQPDKNLATWRYPRIQSGEFRTLVSFPISLPPGSTVLSAILSVPVHGTFPAQTVSVQALNASWKVAKVTWGNQPLVTGVAAQTVVAAPMTDGTRLEVDVTALVQAIVNGQPNYGWRVFSNLAASAGVFKGFESGVASWELTIETSANPAAPADLSPQGTISLQKWVAKVDEVDDLAAMQVQVDANMTAPFDYDTGEVPTTVPQLDLTGTFPAGTANGVANTSYPGLADAAATNWRARVKTIDGSWSDWSDWAQVTRRVKPALSLTTPATVLTATPTITASLAPAGTASTRWQVIVTELNDPTAVLYDSGDAITGATLSHKLPARWNGAPVFLIDGSYRLVVRCWDRPDRVPSYGDRTYIESVTTLTIDTDDDGNPPDTLLVEQVAEGHPDVRLRWTRDAITTPVKFIIIRNGERYVELEDPAEYEVAPDTWEWIDEGAPPNADVTYRVRAVTIVSSAERQSDNSPLASIYTDVTGIWLRSDFGDVLLYGDEIGEWRQTERRVTYELPFRTEPVDIVTAKAGGYEGRFNGIIENRGEQNVDVARSRLSDLRKTPNAEVRLIAGTLNMFVHLRALSVSPHPTIIPDRNRAHTVSFDFFQIDPRD